MRNIVNAIALRASVNIVEKEQVGEMMVAGLLSTPNSQTQLIDSASQVYPIKDTVRCVRTSQSRLKE